MIGCMPTQFLELEGGWGLVEIHVMYKMHAYQYRVTHLLIFQNSLQMAAIYAYASL